MRRAKRVRGDDHSLTPLTTNSPGFRALSALHSSKVPILLVDGALSDGTTCGQRAARNGHTQSVSHKRSRCGRLIRKVSSCRQKASRILTDVLALPRTSSPSWVTRLSKRNAVSKFLCD